MNARSVRQKLVQLDFFTIGKIRKISGQRIVEAELFFFRQPHHGRGSELLADGADAELRFRCDLSFAGKVGEAEALLEDDFSVASYQHGHPRCFAGRYLAQLIACLFRERGFLG